MIIVFLWGIAFPCVVPPASHFRCGIWIAPVHSAIRLYTYFHAPVTPGFAATCNVCGIEMQADARAYRCDECSDYDVCEACRRSPNFKHEHPLRPTGAAVGSATQEDRERVERMQQLHRTMQLLVHASACSDRHCPSTNCMKVKALFQHGLTCPTKVAGGCMLCRMSELHGRRRAGNLAVGRGGGNAAIAGCRVCHIHCRSVTAGSSTPTVASK